MKKVKSFLFPTLYALILLIILTIFSSPVTTETAAITGDAQSTGAVTSGIYRGVSTAVQFDVSPPLTELVATAVVQPRTFTEIPERDSGLEGPLGPQDIDPSVQTTIGPNVIPPPIVSFDGPTNLAGVSPPDPVGDVGPNHYVAMSNLFSAVYDKTGTPLLGPFPNNTLWAGFGGDCETDNSGDPVVLYDQFADRWILTQFTASGPTFFNCVAISQTPDPTGAYFRYAFSTGTNFPDYPKYGVWSDAYYISTRETTASSIGAYAINRAQMIAGNPAPQIISFLVPLGGTPYNVGDGLLPTDIDGSTMPPAGAPNYFVGSMDDGGQYGAPSDALNIWEFHVDFVTPPNSTFTLEHVVPVDPFDSQFPCTPTSRNCIPQPTTANKVDILSYRQRPIWRLAYRNFGSHESLVTNQSVEAAPNIAGTRWYEIRDPDNAPFIFQQGTYAPGVADGIHRWMGSIAMDRSGNMALGFSASDATSTFPSVWYTGRLASDPLGTMPQGEGSIIDGTGSQTSSPRWGDYSSMNVDPVDDCTFWYVNEYLPVNSGNGWVLRIGAFKFDECGVHDFFLESDPSTQAICAPDDALYDISIGSGLGYNDQVDLSALGNPAGSTASFDINNQPAPYSSTLTIGNTGAAAPGNYSIDVVGMAPTSTHTTTVQLNLFDAAPGSTTLAAPADGASDVSTTPYFEWSAVAGANSYLLEVATDSAFNTIVYSATIAPPATSHLTGSPLAVNTSYFWRVTADNVCGGTASATFDFTTRLLEYCSAPGTAINGGPHTDDLVVGDIDRLQDLDVELNITHSWIGDLIIDLEHVDTGTSVSLVDQPGNPLFGTDGCNDNNLVNFLLTDGSTNGPHDNACTNTDSTPGYPAGSDWDPIQPLSAFNDEGVAGTWELTIVDAFTSADDGTLDRWCLVPTVSANTAPVATADTYTTTEGIMLSVPAPGVLTNDTDNEGDDLTAVLDTDVVNGTLTLNADGSFVYTPNIGFDGIDIFTYHANDGIANSNVVTVTITVFPMPQTDIYLPAVFKV